MTKATKMVFGTRTNKWYEVDSTDRDYSHGISLEVFATITNDEAKAMYLAPTRS